jgi:hypothetical protein
LVEEAGTNGRRPYQQSGRYVGQPDCLLSDPLARHEAKRRPRSSEEGVATAKHHGMEVELVLVDEAKLGQAACKDRAANIDLAADLGFDPSYCRLEIVRDKRGVGSN